MTKIALVTGILGQDGPYLAKLLLEKGYKVYGMMRRYSAPNFENTDYLGVTKQIEFVEGDMTDKGSIIRLIKSLRPSEVYNIAAQSFVGASWDMAELTTMVNALGPLYFLEAIKQNSPDTKFYQASTSEMLGYSQKEGGFQDETTPFHPRSPYGVAKLYGYWITRNYRESYNMFTTNGILFNHESPIRGKQFVTRKITDGVAQIKLGLTKELRMGNMDAYRDWGFAGDYVEAMYLMMQATEPDDFMIASGETHSVKEFAELAFRAAGIEDYEKYIVIDPRFMRPAEVPRLHGIITKAKEKLGWEPKVKLPELVSMMVDADIKRHQEKINFEKSK